MWIRNKNMQLMNLKTEELKILALEYLDDDNIPDYYGGPSNYSGYGNKMGIGGTKNMFLWLMIGHD